jgi:hypothetical protein
MVHGLTMIEISKEIGYHEKYWGLLRIHSKLFQEYLYAVRDLLEQSYLTSEVRLHNAVIERRLERFQQRALGQQQRQRARDQQRRQRKLAQLSEVSGASAGTPPRGALTQPESPKPEGTQAGSRPLPAPPPQQRQAPPQRQEVAPVPVFTAPARQSWQDLIAKRKAETAQYAWQSPDGTSGRR